MEFLIITPGKKHEEFKELNCGISGRILSPFIHPSISPSTCLLFISPLPYIIAQQYLITYSGDQ
jgi:hypothetical protein